MKKILMLASFLSFLSFNLAHAQTEAEKENVVTKPEAPVYKMFDVPCTIDHAFVGDKLHIQISAPEGMELPETVALEQDKVSFAWNIRTKVLDGKLFPDSEGFPLAGYAVTVLLKNHPEQNVMTYAVQKRLNVLQSRGWLDKRSKSQSDSKYLHLRKMQLNMANKPQFVRSKENPRHIEIICDIIFAE